jgi:iron complex transport system permease protein
VRRSGNIDELGSGAIMKITLDLTALVEEGKLTGEEAERLRVLAARETGSLAINILVGFGVVAVSAGAVALLPTPATALAVGLAVFVIGLAFTLGRNDSWSLLAQICLVVGALMFCGGVLALGQASLAALLIVTAALAAAAIVARSGLLMAAAVLALGACLGARAGYWHATYALAIYEPAVTIVLFSLLALAAYIVSKRLTADYERLALIAARTSVFMVNFGFWIGSLWGDNLRLVRSILHNDPSILTSSSGGADIISPGTFAAGWAVALLGVGLWGMHANRRWVVNVAAVFGAIHFYTQWFDWLGPEPASFIIGGLLMLVFALALWSFNRRYRAKA